MPEGPQLSPGLPQLIWICQFRNEDRTRSSSWHMAQKPPYGYGGRAEIFSSKRGSESNQEIFLHSSNSCVCHFLFQFGYFLFKRSIKWCSLPRHQGNHNQLQVTKPLAERDVVKSDVQGTRKTLSRIQGRWGDQHNEIFGPQRHQDRTQGPSSDIWKNCGRRQAQKTVYCLHPKWRPYTVFILN